MITKDLHAHRVRNLHQEKSLRDHGVLGCRQRRGLGKNDNFVTGGAPASGRGRAGTVRMWIVPHAGHRGPGRRSPGLGSSGDRLPRRGTEPRRRAGSAGWAGRTFAGSPVTGESSAKAAKLYRPCGLLNEKRIITAMGSASRLMISHVQLNSSRSPEVADLGDRPAEGAAILPPAACARRAPRSPPDRVACFTAYQGHLLRPDRDLELAASQLLFAHRGETFAHKRGSCKSFS